MLFNLYCITNILIKDYFDYNKSYIGLSDVIYYLYTGLYYLYIFEDCYAILHKQGNILVIIFLSNKGDKKTIYRLVKQIDKIKKDMGVDTILFKTKIAKNYEFLNKLAKEKYLMYVI